MKGARDILRQGLRQPDRLLDLTEPEWDLLIRQARSAGLLAKVHALLDARGLLAHVPKAPRMHLSAAATVASSQEEVVRWEVYCIQRALAAVKTEIVLLKGAAYVLGRLPIAHGRLLSDVDILVPKSRLTEVEAALLQHGWTGLKLEKYDQRFYRQWSHELPPLFHARRETVLDVHHNILPGTGRLHPDSEKLLQAAEPIEGTPYKRLSAPDMVLHTSAHMFQDGDLGRPLRELADIDGLLRTFGATEGFWDALVRRAPEMDLQRPLFYALRYSSRYLHTPVPEQAITASTDWGPSASTLAVMDRLVAKALESKYATTFGSGSARWLLYVRSHWLRMPPLLLARHLAHQSLRRVWVDVDRSK